MDKKTVVNEMKASVKGSSFISVGALAKYLGKGKAYAASLVRGLDKIPGEPNGTKYFIPDVAEKIMEVRRV